MDQAPHDSAEEHVLELLMSLSPREFEYAAKEIISLMDNRLVDMEVTRPVKDGGHDIIGYLKVGHERHELLLSVHAEAKRWGFSRAVGVKPMARLISRLKHKDLGIFVTTSYFEKQIQTEIIEDRRPIILISGGDAARILIRSELAGKGRDKQFAEWTDSVRSKCQNAS